MNVLGWCGESSVRSFFAGELRRVGVREGEVTAWEKVVERKCGL